MARSEYQGKRGANAGDDYHELWAVRRAMQTLVPASRVQEVTVEGVRAGDETGHDDRVWDGVDCATFLGDGPDRIDRIEIVQLKYSGASPQDAWTVARLVATSNKAGDNSLIARLATAYAALASSHPELAGAGSIDVKVVSNQPVAAEVERALRADEADPARTRLVVASGLDGSTFPAFARALDFSDCGSESRFAIEERVIGTISEWADDDANVQLSSLRTFVRNRMKPEGHRLSITRESILGVFGHADPRSFFPARSRIHPIERLVSRSASSQVRDLFVSGQARVCLHGAGGEGKTTVLQDLAGKLPAGSVVIAYDCYGAGTYLDSDAYRHRERDAFTQLANESSAELKLPLLFSGHRESDHPRRFARRLARVAEALAAGTPGALLVVAVDAADNAITAAERTSETSFTSAFMALGTLPENVRLMVSARTGRLATLAVPATFARVELGPFTKQETILFVEDALPGRPSAWLDDLHVLSGGNPRVQRYALEFGAGDPEATLAYLKPNGKDLSGIFRSRFEEAISKGGNRAEVERLCAGLVALPRPVPVAHLAAVTSLAPAHVVDLALDLAPGLSLEHEAVGFADEDFERFVEEVAEPAMDEVRRTAAERLNAESATNAYAAEHAGSLLLATGKGAELLALAKVDPREYPIADLAVRGEVHRARLQAAMRFCRLTGSDAEAVSLLLLGADAMKTDAAVRRTLFDNTDLAVAFSRERIVAEVLRDKDRRPHHGELLMQVVCDDARASDWVAVRVGRRLLWAWFDSRNDHLEMAKDREDGWHRQEKWPLSAGNAAAYIEAGLREKGGGSFVSHLSGARPGRFRRDVFRALVFRLAEAGEHELLATALDALPKRFFGREIARALLALDGRPIAPEPLLQELERAAAHEILGADKLEDEWGEEGRVTVIQELLLTACEVALIAGGDRARIAALLALFAPEKSRKQAVLTRWSTRNADMAARAFALRRNLLAEPVSFDDFVLAAPKPAGKEEDYAAKERRESELRKAREMFAPLLDIYTGRARAIAGALMDGEDQHAGIEAAVGKLRDARRYQTDRYETSERDQYAGRSLLILAALPGANADKVLNLAKACFGGEQFPFVSAASVLLSRAALFAGLRPRVLLEIAGICDDVRQRKLPADEKIEVLTRYARVALPLDLSLSRRCFDAATSVAGEIDRESLPALAVCSPFAERAAKTMDEAARRTAGLSLAAVSQDAAVRIGSDDQFPWTAIMTAMTCLDPAIAMAVCGRFDDIGHVRLDDTLETTFRVAIRRASLDPDVVVALMSILHHGGQDLLRELLQGPARAAGGESLSDELSREVLLRDKAGPADASTWLGGQARASDGHWTAALHRTATFLAERPDRTSEPTPRRARERYVIPNRDWNAIASVEELLAAFEEIKANAPAGVNLYPDDLFGHALDSIAPVNRARYLDFIAAIPPDHIIAHRLGMLIRDRVKSWSDTACVKLWCRDRLLQVVKLRLPNVARYLYAGETYLPELLELSGASDAEIVRTLLEGVELNIEELGSSTLFGIIGVIGARLTPSDAAKVLQGHLQSRLARIDFEERELAGMDDVGGDILDAVARFIYAQLGSIEAPRRWRAAHAVRKFARLGRSDIIDRLVAGYGREREQAFAHPEAPFYYLNARLWLLIALARVAWENPGVILKHRAWLLEQAESNAFPHVLVWQFAKLALEGLSQAYPEEFSKDDLARVARVNTSSLARRKRPKNYGYRAFNSHQYETEEKRRFRFDTMDSLPYWYDPAIRGFAKPDPEKFLDRAESWIVDRWGASGEPHKTDDFRGRDRFHGRDWAKSSNRHGALPTIEPYRSYLEWHAMFCAAGDFLTEYPLAKEPPGEWGSYEDWLHRSGLTLSPLWLSDLRGPKPLEEELWSLPEASDAWLRGVGRADVERELALTDPDWIVIAAGHRTRRSGVSANVRIESCLVSRGNTASLRLALEASENSYQYRLAIGDDEDHAIDRPPFVLKALLRDWGGDRELDTYDRLRADVGAPSYAPKAWVCEALGLSRSADRMPFWVGESGEVALRWHSWGDRAEEDGRGEAPFYSEGGRLLIRRAALRDLLAREGLDFLVEVTIKHQRSEPRDDGRGEKETKETEYDRILVLREDGTVDATGERYGRWAPARTRAGPSRKRRHARTLDGLPHRGTDEGGRDRAHS